MVTIIPAGTKITRGTYHSVLTAPTRVLNMTPRQISLRELPGWWVRCDLGTHYLFACLRREDVVVDDEDEKTLTYNPLDAVAERLKPVQPQEPGLRQDEGVNAFWPGNRSKDSFPRVFIEEKAPLLKGIDDLHFTFTFRMPWQEGRMVRLGVYLPGLPNRPQRPIAAIREAGDEIYDELADGPGDRFQADYYMFAGRARAGRTNYPGSKRS